ncbi:hypothetical protein F2Q69_00039609, partial [Brassica cretica]
VYEQSIGAAAQLDWPKERILIQVLDDSDDPNLQLLIKEEVSAWAEKGVNIIYRHRLIRTGYKAGNLKSAMTCDYVKDYEFVTIFDADFTPSPDFLKKTVPHFKGNPELGLVQARWSFVNKDENLLTRLQNINLCFHFEVEQQVNGVFLNFFGFNGTAGVWRIKALEESGGWLERTTVEDMDIAVRAHLNGWKFIYLNDVEVTCELPESYEAYKKQQHRWHSGPMQLFRLCLPSIIKSKISAGKKANLIFLFFLLRKLILPFYSFTLFCIILPLTMFIPEAELPLWIICYVPIFISLLNILPSPKSFPFLIPYLLFENTMSITKFNAMISGLFQLGSAYEWVVTKKTNLIFLFFLLRKLILPFYSFTLFCIILPLTMFIPEAELPLWIICYVPILISLLNILPSPKSFPFLIPYLLFENTMSITKFNAMISGLFQLGSAYEWVVTKKTGRSSESDLLAFAEKEEKLHRRNSESGLELLSKLKEQEMNLAEQETPKKTLGGLVRPKNKIKKRNMVFKKELALAFLLLTAAARSFLSAHGLHFYFLLFQGLSFLVVGLDLIGEQIN